MSPERQLHLNAVIVGLGQFAGGWRLPGVDATAYTTADHLHRLGAAAERGTLDAVFLADIPLSADVEYGPGHPLDPTIALATLAARTEHVGLVSTLSTTFNAPFDVARRLSTLDHLTGGRTGWNVVSTVRSGVTGNFGGQPLPDHRERYARADEFLRVARGLWDGWAPDALRADPGTGVFADPERVHALEHVGEHFRVRGPLTLPRSPQGHPVIFQAGASDTGLDFAARHADAVFTVQHTIEQAVRYSEDLRDRAEAAGRARDAIRVFPGLLPVIGRTAEEAEDRRRRLEDAAPLRYGIVRLAERLAIDPDALDPDREFPVELLPAEEDLGPGVSRGFFRVFRELVQRERLPVRELVRRLGGGRGHLVVTGTPSTIADTIEEWFRAGAADGFTLFADVLPTGLEAFVDLVVPELRRRGLFRSAYTSPTLRGHYGLEQPAYRPPRTLPA